MTPRTGFLALAAVVLMLAATPVRAGEAGNGGVSAVESVKIGFSQAVKTVKGWFGGDEAGEPMTDPAAIEPAAGDEDLQVPPPYMGDQSAADPDILPRATAFDDVPSVAAFGGGEGQDASDLANIMPAAGDDTAIDISNVACESVLEAAMSEDIPESEKPEADIVAACEAGPADTEAASAPAPAKDVAQPGFDNPGGAPVIPQPLPETNPAAGDADEQPEEAQ